MRSGTGLLSCDEAIRIVDESLAGARLPAECVPVREALGRVLAQDQVSRLDLPPFDRSAMDGYATPEGDDGPEYRLVGTVGAGEVSAAPLALGTAVKVMTGAPVPWGTGRVVRVEDAQCDGRTVRVLRYAPERYVAAQGEDVRVGDGVLEAGTVLGPLDVANLVSCGIAIVEVARRPRLAIASTGDEIVDDPENLAPGRIMNANGPLLRALAGYHGLDVVSETTVPDRPEDTIEALRSAVEAADIVAVSGGVSVGDFDYVPGAMADLGLVPRFAGVAIKPGKPVTYASGGRAAVFGLPGNPVGVYVTFHLFVLRAVARMVGSAPGLREVALEMGPGYSRRDAERREFVPARLGEMATVEPLEYHGSAHLMALSRMDGLFVVPEGVAEVPAGSRVRFLPKVGSLA